MQKLCAFILFYLVIGCLSTSVYAELYMWTDEKGIKHFSNTALNEQGKNVRQEEEIKFDEAKYQEIIEQQKAYEEQQAAEKAIREEKEFKEREIQAVNKLGKAIREEKEVREKEIQAVKKLEEKVRKAEESGYQNPSTLTVIQTPKISKSSTSFENGPHIKKSRENSSEMTLENQKRKEYEEEVQRVNKYNKEVDEYNSQQNKGISPFNVKKSQNHVKTGGINFRKPYLGKDDPNRSYFERHPLGR